MTLRSISSIPRLLASLSSKPVTSTLGNLAKKPSSSFAKFSFSKTDSLSLKRSIGITPCSRNQILEKSLPVYHHHQEPLIAGKAHEYVCVVTNEKDQRKAQLQWKTVPLHGNALMGCSVLVLVNFASLRREITHIAAFDVNEKVEKCWKDLRNIVLQDTPTRDQVQSRIEDYLRKDPRTLDDFREEVDTGLSFLSDEARFAKSRTLFSDPHFSFTRMDVCNPLAFAHFLKEHEKRNITPGALYLSNIASCILFGRYGEAVPGESHVAKHRKYKGFSESLTIIPDQTVVVDAREPWIDNQEAGFSRLRVHQTMVKETLMPTPCPCLYLEVLVSDNYDAVMQSLKSGAHRLGSDPSGYTSLMYTAETGKNNSLRALIDYAKATGTLQDLLHKQDRRGYTALDIATQEGNLSAVEILRTHMT